jgi:hypothetical protein
MGAQLANIYLRLHISLFFFLSVLSLFTHSEKIFQEVEGISGPFAYVSVASPTFHPRQQTRTI